MEHKARWKSWRPEVGVSCIGLVCAWGQNLSLGVHQVISEFEPLPQPRSPGLMALVS